MDRLSIRNLILIIIIVLCIGAAVFFGIASGKEKDSHTASSTTSTEVTEDQHIAKTDTERYYHRPVLIAANGSVEFGSGANAWEGMCEYLGSDEITDAYYLCEDNKQSILSAIDALEEPSSVVPNIIFLTGTHAGEAVAEAQQRYEGTYFVVLESDMEAPAQNTCCINFASEEAGFLAGYGCVMEGATRIRFAAEKETPETLSYYYGFLQGVDKAAKDQSISVNVSSCFTMEAAHAARDGSPQIVFACGSSEFQQSMIDIVKNANERIICSGHDYGYLFPGNLAETSPICASTVNNYGAVCVSILTAFNPEGWGQFYAGQKLRYGLNLGDTLGLSATAASWHFQNFDVSQYYQILGMLRSGAVQVANEEPLCSEWVSISSLDIAEEGTQN